jgi:ribosomal protein L11 methyltransferase
MSTYSALTTTAGQAAADALAADLERLAPEPTGVGVFEIEDGADRWEVAAYFVEPPDVAGLAIFAAMHGARPFVVSDVPDQDWVAKVRRELVPVRAGRFFVYGAHDADHIPDDCVPLLIEASMAFGTGHHGTTRGCLEAFENLIAGGVVPRNVVDVGCGTAVLAMAAAATTAARIIASDVDPVAVDVARANLAANGLDARVACVVAAGFDAPELTGAAPFDLVFANILKGPLVALAPRMAHVVARDGYVILSGILNEQAEAVKSVYFANGFNLVSEARIVDWTTITLQQSPSKQ